MVQELRFTFAMAFLELTHKCCSVASKHPHVNPHDNQTRYFYIHNLTSGNTEPPESMQHKCILCPVSTSFPPPWYKLYILKTLTQVRLLVDSVPCPVCSKASLYSLLKLTLNCRRIKGVHRLPPSPCLPSPTPALVYTTLCAKKCSLLSKAPWSTILSACMSLWWAQ